MTKFTATQTESLIQLLTRIYMDIAEMENDFQLLVGEGDFRPRIEYFHDAVRAISSNDSKARENGGRLSAEMLAYDLKALRFIIAKPLSHFLPQPHSPSVDVIEIDKNLPSKSRRPDRATRERLSEFYQHYAALFSALLKPAADRDWKDRTEEAHMHIEDLHTLLSREKDPKKIAEIKRKIAAQDEEAGKAGQAHMDYAMAQLGIYEDAKDMIKSLADKGMNLVGKFVEASIAETKSQMGR